jgi:histidyl-tRNA synthetase
MARRNHIFSSIRSVFELYGYQQIETPAMELLNTLTGKYGEEGDQLLFKILNSRIHESRKKEELLAEFNRALEHNVNSDLLTERALRYDLTVPFARYVVMHQNEITFPFKRFQMQPVWRADRPQKGRYREFYQCDADVIGSGSLVNEAELVNMVDDIFIKLSVAVTIKMNNRKILTALSSHIKHPDKIIDITIAIDKLDKVGLDQVLTELLQKGLSKEAIEQITPLLSFRGTDQQKLELLEKLFESSPEGQEGIAEIRKVFTLADCKNLELDLTLARGLNYYTGAIFEVRSKKVQIGSIAGGGRYDNLTGIFGLPGVSGVGISFGVDRIYDVMDELKLFDNLELNTSGIEVMIVNFGSEMEAYCMELLREFRNAGISSGFYPDAAKLKKQFGYADSMGIPFVITAGSEEIKSGQAGIKNMKTGEQLTIARDKLTAHLTDLIRFSKNKV